MNNDPLILQFVKLLKEDEATAIESLATSNFESLYQVGLAQGRIQGIRMAHAALDSAMRAVDE